MSYERRAITYLLSNPQSATSNRQCSYPPSPLSSPRRVEEILIINCHLPIVVFGRPHRVAPTNNLNSRSLVLLSFLCKQESNFFPIRKQQPAIGNVFIPLTFILSPQGRGNFNYQCRFVVFYFLLLVFNWFLNCKS